MRSIRKTIKCSEVLFHNVRHQGPRGWRVESSGASWPAEGLFHRGREGCLDHAGGGSLQEWTPSNSVNRRQGVRDPHCKYVPDLLAYATEGSAKPLQVVFVCVCVCLPQSQQFGDGYTSWKRRYIIHIYVHSSGYTLLISICLVTNKSQNSKKRLLKAEESKHS